MDSVRARRAAGRCGIAATTRYAGGAGLLLLLPACSLFFSLDDDPPPVTDRDGGTVIPVDAEAPPEVNRAFDILFVIDNSESMEEEQASLGANFDRFIGVLQQIEGGLPDVHIAVVTTDMGASSAIPRCNSSDDGAFQSTPSVDCSLGDGFSLDGSFLVDVADDTQPDMGAAATTAAV